MIGLIFQLRLRQLFRTIAEIGLLRLLFLIPFLLMLTGTLLSKIMQGKGTVFFLVLIIISLAGFHLSRKDKSFVSGIFKQPELLYFFEYQTIILPFYIAFALTSVYAFFALFLSAVIIAYLPYSINWRSIKLNSALQIFPAALFEWNAGFRKNGFWMAIIYIPILIYSGKMSVIPIGVFILALFIAGFNIECEPLPMLEAYRKTTGKFLNSKIGLQIKCFSILISPLFLLFLIFFPGHFYVIALAMILSWLLIAYSIAIRYAFYQPSHKATKNLIFIGIFMACFTEPFLFPVPVLLFLKFYFQAIKNLKTYLDDYH